MKYVKIYNEKMQCLGVADIEQNYDKDGYVKLFDATTMKFQGVVDVDDIPESGDNMPVVKVFDENMQPCGVVTADNIRHSDGYLIRLQKDPSTTGTVTGGGRFIAGTSVTVVATPDAQSDYPEFDGWYEGETKVSENASYTFTVSGARTLVAKFKEAATGNVITYTADAKLTETTSDKNAGLHTNAFDDATITSHTFENGVGKISFNKPVVAVGNYAFNSCSGLTSITIPDSVTSIGKSAFHRCSGLTSITIPDSVTSIGELAFNSCSGLTSIVVDKGNTVYDSRDNCNAIIETSTNTLILGCKNTVIPDSVTSIGNYAFENCSGLTSITIPNSVTSIGNYAFRGCSGLISVVCYQKDIVPILGTGAFNTNHLGRKIYVPVGSVDAYRAASGWSVYADDIEAIQE